MSPKEFTKRVDDGLRIAESHGKTYKWITNGPIGPAKAKYLTEKGIEIVKTLGD